LAPADLAPGHGRQEALLLLFAGKLQQHWPEHPDTQVDLRRAAMQAAHLPIENGYLLRTQPTAAIFHWPVGAEPALVAHALEPQALVLMLEFDSAPAPDHLVGGHGRAHGRRAVALEPGTGFLAKCF